jgi:hypothetical protein
LRKDAIARCIYCHHLMEWYERFDTGTRVPLLPQEFPSRLLPERYHWSVFNGLVYLGDGGAGVCRIVHPAVCPVLEHDDDPVMRGIRRAYAVRTMKWIQEGAFVPAPRKDVIEEDIVEQFVQSDTEVRHVVQYSFWTWLAPTTIDQIQCVALAATTGGRCKKTILDSDRYEGQWAQTAIPVPPGRSGKRQATVWEGQQMWVYDLNALYPDEYSRWRSQRCTTHQGASTPDAAVPQWVPFDVFRHSEFIAYERPKVAGERRREEHPLLSLVEARPDGARCVGAGCTNRSHGPEKKGWLCWQCEPAARRRARIHMKWQAAPPEQDPPF